MWRLASLAFVVASSSAQEPPREGIFGEVHTTDGKVWVGATVTLLHVAHPAVDDARFVDRVTATTDERGRFRAQLLAGMTYVAWSEGPVADGAWRSSAIARDVAAGVPVLLREGDERRQRTVRLEPDASWRGAVRLVAQSRFGPFTMRADLPLVDGSAVLPKWPESWVMVHVELDGVPVHRGAVSTSFPAFVASRKRSAEDEGKPEPAEADLRREFAAPHVLVVGPRVEHAIRLVDTGKRPLAGARVIEDGNEPRRLLGVADRDGIVRWAHAVEARLPNRALAYADGCAETSVDAEDWADVAAAEPKDKVMAPGTAVRGRMLVTAGEAAAAQPLLLEGSIATGETSSYFGVDARLFVSAADGTLEVPGRIATHAYYLTTVLTAAQRARLAGPTKAPVAAVALLVPPGKAAPADLGELRLDRLQPIDVRVVGVDGAEPGPVPIVVIPNPRGGVPGAPHEPIAARTDRHGRLRLLATAGAECAVWAMGRDGAAWVVATPGNEELRLQLDAAHALRLQVADKDGRALAGVTAHVVAPEGTPVGVGAPALMPCVHDAFMVHGFPWKQAVTDAQGLAQLVMPFAGIGIDVVFYFDSTSMRTTLGAGAFMPGEPARVEYVPNGR